VNNVREFSSLKALTKQELVQLSECKTSHIVKRRNHFKEGDTVNEFIVLKMVFVIKLSANGKDHIVKLVTKVNY
jgi:hypothetical protein